jgi:predicted O-linked N-acetylglucosamine transferase (SPINDLY family)
VSSGTGQAHPAGNPADIDALDMAARACLQAGDLGAASVLFARALTLAPSHPVVLNNLALLLLRSGRHVDALRALVRALAARADIADIHVNCGGILFELAEWQQAIGCYDRALALDPGRADAHANRASALQFLGRFADPRPGYRRALALHPAYPEAHSGLAGLDQGVGRLNGAIRRLRRALAVEPRQSSIHSNLLFCLTYAESVDNAALYRAFRGWESRHAAPLYAETRPHDNGRDPERRLRVGYLSADFRDHPVGHSLVASLERHDRSEVELTLYALLRSGDETTRRFQRAADRWRWVAGMDERLIAGQIRADAIDVLVLVAPHTGGHRPLVAALKPAPVQVAMYDLSTTGMQAVDAVLTDRFVQPAGGTERFAEQLVHIPCLVNNDPPPPVPTPPPPSLTRPVAFGSFNNPAKMTPGVVALWAEVLKAVPDSRLTLKYLDRYSDPALRDLVLERFAGHGIGADRLDLRTRRIARPEQLALLGEVDVALDPFPFNGCTATFEALWMGVPVVALEGVRFLGLMSASFLRHLGLDELVAADHRRYVDIAASLAADVGRRSVLRRELRARVAASPLCDAEAHARSLVTAYRGLWRRWCAGAAPAAPVVREPAPV